MWEAPLLPAPADRRVGGGADGLIAGGGGLSAEQFSASSSVAVAGPVFNLGEDGGQWPLLCGLRTHIPHLLSSFLSQGVLISICLEAWACFSVESWGQH